MKLEPLLTAKEAADFLRTSVRTVHRACSNGEFDHVMLDGKELRFTTEHLQVFIESRTVGARSPKPVDAGQGAPGAGHAEFEDPAILTETDVATILGISVRAVRGLVKAKKLRSIGLTKRKQVFTRGLIDEFLQGEKGLNKVTQEGRCFDPRVVGPAKTPISLEESRSLLKDLRKEMSLPGSDERLTFVSQRR